MDTVEAFNDQLFHVIMERQQLFDSFLLAKLQEEYRISQSAAKTIKTVLIKKGVLHDDPYKYDSKISEIEVPVDEAYTESERAVVIGSRLSQYEAMLDYMNNYYTFTCDFLSTDRINKLVALNRTFYWESFSNTSAKPNTKGLAELVATVRTGGDPLSSNILNDALTQLSKSSIAITKALKSLTEFHRERYKVAVRKLVLPGAILNPESIINGGVTTAIKEIKRSFAVNMKEQPFYTELIEEILKEEYSPDHAVLQQELLQRLSITKTDSTHKVEDESIKPVLLDGIRTLGAISPQLDQIATKMFDNQTALDNLEKSFFEKFASLLRKAFNIAEKPKEVSITTVDPITQSAKREMLDITLFIEGIRRRSRIYTGFTIKTSAAYQKIEIMEETHILDLLTRHIAEVNTLIKQCSGIDEYFKQTIPNDSREKIRGIKVEISAVKNNLVKANQCRAEYTSQLEEQQQLKKLGITHV